MVNPELYTGVFAGRQTFLRFREYLPGATQPWISQQRRAAEMGRTQDAVLEDVTNQPHIGWMLRSYHLRPGDATWLTAAQSGNLAGTTIAPNTGTFMAFSQQSISGVTYNSDVAMTGGPMNVIRPPAGNDWSTNNLTADLAAYSQPNPSEDFVPMNRVFVDNTVAPWDNLLFNIWPPSSAITPRSSIATLYFNGPAGSDQAAINDSSKLGTGRYSLKYRGDGFAYLYEMLNDGTGPSNATWKRRYSFLWNTESRAVSWTMLHVVISNNLYKDANGNYQGDTITFGQGLSNDSPGQFSQIQNLAELSNMEDRFQKGQVPTYIVPRVTNQPLTLCDIRIDIPIECRANFSAAKHVYVSTGLLLDDLFSLDQPATQSRTINLVWTGVLPDGCQWSSKMYDQSGNMLAQVGAQGAFTSAQGQTAYAFFQPTANMVGGRVEIDFVASSDQFRTPILSNWAVYGPPIYDNQTTFTYTIPNRSTDLPALWMQTIERVEVASQRSDPGSENATIIVQDMTGDLEFLENVNLIPVYLYTTDPNTTTNPSGQNIDIFRGYCLIASGERYRTDPTQNYPNEFWTKWTLHCIGEWIRIMDATLPRRQIWQDTSTGLNSKVTDCVRNMLQSVYTPSMVNVPDNSTRLFGQSPGTWTMEPGTRVADLCQDWMTDYFGGWVLWDVAAGDVGMFRGFFQRTPPYNNTVIFEMDHPTLLASDGLPRIPQWAASYPTTIGAGGQRIQHTFMQAGSFNPHLERAEADAVVVYGGGVGKDAKLAVGSDAAQFTQMAVNVKAFNFLNLAPSNPNYPSPNYQSYFGRLIPTRVFRYDLPNQAAVNWFCRRVYDRSCFARYYLAFTAPLIDVFDVTDPLQQRNRFLRYYDPVLIRGYDGTLNQFIVLDCKPSYVKDDIQMGRYLCVTQENINQKAVAVPIASYLRAALMAEARIRGIDMRNAKATPSAQKQGLAIASEIMSLPTPSSTPIQQLDPTKPNFGAFFSMPGYSTVGGPDINH